MTKRAPKTAPAQTFLPPQLVELEQGSEAWHAFRTKHIGASDVPVIMRVSPYTKPMELWEIKTLRRAHSVTSSAATAHGVEREPILRQKYVEMTGNFGGPAVYEMQDWPEWLLLPEFKTLKPQHLSASLDFITGKDRIAEFKNPYDYENYLLAKEGTLPEKDYPQVQAQLLVMANLGIETCDYCSCYGQEVSVIPVTLNRDYVSKDMLPAIDRFLTAVAEDRWPFPEGEREFTDEEQVALGKQLAIAKAMLKMADQRVTALQAKVMEFAYPFAKAKVGNIEVIQTTYDEKQMPAYTRRGYVKTEFKVRES